MQTKLFFPVYFKFIGLITLIPFLLLGYNCMFNELQLDFLTFRNPSWYNPDLSFFNFDLSVNNKIININYTNDLAIIGIMLSLLFIAFSKQKIEDEYIQNIRLESFLIAIIVNTILFIITTLMIHGLAYFYISLINVYTTLLVFSLRFYYKILIK